MKMPGRKKSALKKPEHRKEHIKKDSNRYLLKNSEPKPNLCSECSREGEFSIDAIQVKHVKNLRLLT